MRDAGKKRRFERLEVWKTGREMHFSLSVHFLNQTWPTPDKHGKNPAFTDLLTET